MSEKKIPQQEDSTKSNTQKLFSEDSAEQSSSPQLPLDHINGVPPELPTLTNNQAIRRQFVQRLQGHIGNAAVVRGLSVKGSRSATTTHPAAPGARPGFLQRDDEQVGDGNGGAPAASAGGGPVHPATEDFYDVTGATLNDITGQLAHYDGRWGAQTETQLGISTEEMPIQRQPNGTLRVEVPWSINSAVIGLPRWINYDEACAAAQQEWDRFVGRARQHEQEAHVAVAYQFVRDLGPRDRVVTGRNPGALRRNLAAKQRELSGRLRTAHDGCDHGDSIDATLHPDNGRCN